MLASVTTISPRGWKFETDEHPCNDEQKGLIEAEIAYAWQLTDYTIKDLKKGDYNATFFAKSLVDEEGFEDKVLNSYRNIAKMLDGSDRDYDIRITCDFNSEYCLRNNWMAHMRDKEKKMNFCKTFFEVKKTELSVHGPTDEKLNQCGTLDLRQAQHSRSATIIHECTYTRFAMNGQERYGFSHQPEGKKTTVVTSSQLTLALVPPIMHTA
jgi:hypothetical protein